MNLAEVTVSRTIAASPEKIFDIWMDPKSPGGPWFGGERHYESRGRRTFLLLREA